MHQATLYLDPPSRYYQRGRVSRAAGNGLNLRKTVRILGISLALVALLVFATGVVSDWNHQSPSDDANCPYCHLGHQTPSGLAVAPTVALLKPIAFLPLPEVVVPVFGAVFSQTAPRAPPV
jgi:hypothetical protein